MYWLAPTFDINNWDNSTWYNTPVSSFADNTSLQTITPAALAVSLISSNSTTMVHVENKSKIPAAFLHLELFDGDAYVSDAQWEKDAEHYLLTLWPGEKMSLSVTSEGDLKRRKVKIWGLNVKSHTYDCY